MARPTSLPVELKKYRVSSPFGRRSNPGNPNHIGCDWATPIGVPLEAIIAGKVSAVGGSLTHGWGYYVHIKDDDGNEIEYHILRDKPKFERGDPIRLGQLIGYTGNSGSLRGKRYDPHHHLGCKDGDWYYDPLLIGWSGTAGNGSTPFEEDDMTPEQASQLNSVFNAIFRGGNSMKDDGKSISQSLAEIRTLTTAPIKGRDRGDGEGPQDVSVRQDNADTNTMVRSLIAEVAGLHSALSAVSAGEGADPAVVQEAARAGAAEALKSLKLTVEVD